MWKMFSPQAHEGSSPEFWERTWEKSEASEGAQNDRICENQGSLWRLFQRVLVPDRLFLEGGCGTATWVRYYARRGYRAVGIDFAARTVERIKTLAPYADIRLGDITAFPLATGSVHTYFSGGVVEHFEEGPERALSEARRVLADDGWFLCSVPDASTLRKRVVWPLQGDGQGSWECLTRKVDATTRDSSPPGYSFYQYSFDRQEFSKRLEAAGFRIEEDFGYSLLWGLTEVPGLGSVIRRMSARQGGSASPNPHPPGAVNGAAAPTSNGSARAARDGLKGLIEKIALKEDTSVPVFGGPLRFLIEHCSNMRLYVARPR